jgi:hypothetical protein
MDGIAACLCQTDLTQITLALSVRPEWSRFYLSHQFN